MAESILGLSVQSQGSSGAPLVFIAGPPLGIAIFEQVQRRLGDRRSIAVELTSLGEPATLTNLSRRLQQLCSETGAAGVVAHGLAVPVGLRLEGLPVYISNGPAVQLDPLMRSLALMGPRALSRLLKPELLTRWLASSAGLRRAVSNPYVMDRDTVVRVTEGVVSSAERRRAAAEWICSLASEDLGQWSVDASQVSAIWGDSDPLYPVAPLRKVLSERGGQAPSVILGGRLMHPEERPWELADRVVDAEKGYTATQMS